MQRFAWLPQGRPHVVATGASPEQTKMKADVRENDDYLQFE